MELAKLEKNLPLRAYPKKDLNKVLIMDFLPFISNLLSLTDEVSAKRLELALPAIKDQCIGMGFNEIKKMFEMYADGKLNLKPIPNYFDRILLGKIIECYRFYKRAKNKPMEQLKKPTEAEIERIMLDSIDRIKLEIKENGKINGTAHHIYDFLVDSGRLTFPDAEKKAAFSIAKRMLLSDAKNKAIGDYLLTKQLKKTLSNIENGGNARQIIIAKTLLIENHFKND